MYFRKFINWASDTNYAAGSDPWAATPTKVQPSEGQIATGHIPADPAPAQFENWFKEHISDQLKMTVSSYATATTLDTTDTPTIRSAAVMPDGSIRALRVTSGTTLVNKLYYESALQYPTDFFNTTMLADYVPRACLALPDGNLLAIFDDTTSDTDTHPGIIDTTAETLTMSGGTLANDTHLDRRSLCYTASSDIISIGSTVYKTASGGPNFSATTVTGGTVTCNFVASDGDSTLIAVQSAAGSSRKYHLSTDGGLNYQEQALGPVKAATASDKAYSRPAYLAEYGKWLISVYDTVNFNGTVYESTSGTSGTWTLAANNFQFGLVDLIGCGSVCFGLGQWYNDTQRSLFFSIDGGTTWYPGRGVVGTSSASDSALVDMGNFLMIQSAGTATAWICEGMSPSVPML